MKKLFILSCLVMLLLISSVYAIELNPFATIKNNIENPGNPYPNITLSKTFFWIEGDKIAEYNLRLNTDQSLVKGRAIEQTILYETGSLFDELKFRDKKGNDVIVNNLRTYILKNETYYEVVKDTELVCDNKIGVNGSYKECQEIEVGTHNITKTKEIEVEITNATDLVPGIYNWVIEANKPANIDVDFIIVKNGVELIEHAWWNTNWFKKIQINFSNKYVLEDQIDFPVLVYLNNTNFNISYIQADGDDLRFINSSETGELSFEIDHINTTEILIWVKLPNLSASINTSIWLYYNNSLATNGQNVKDVWSNNYTNVYHMTNINSSTINSSARDQNPMIISTDNTTRSLNASYATGLGIIGTAQRWNRSFEQYTNFTNNWLFDNYTIETIVRAYSFGSNERTIWSTTNQSLDAFFDSSADLIVYKSGNDALGPSSTTNTTYWMGYRGNSTGHTLYLNGNFSASGTGSQELGNPIWVGRLIGSSTLNWDGFIDEFRVSNVSRSGQWMNLSYYSMTNRLSYFGPEVNQETITITLDRPLNNSITGNRTVFFNATISPQGYTVKNITFYAGSNSQFNSTNFITAQTWNWTFNFTTGNYTWNVSACGNDSSNVNNCFNSSVGLFTVDLTPPNLTLYFPQNKTYNDGYITNLTKNINISFNATSPYNISACWYSINQGTTNVSTTCEVNASTNLNYSQYNTTAYANNTLGTVGNSTNESNFEYRIYQSGLSYNNNTIEGVLESFYVNLTMWNSSFLISTIDLIYNNSNYSASFVKSGLNYTANTSFIIPDVTNLINVSFYWNITLSNGTNYSSATFNQSVSNLSIDNCSTNGVLIFNYTLLDEATQVNLSTIANTTIEIGLTLYDNTRTNAVLNFSRLYNRTNLAQVCLNVALTNVTIYSVDSVARYEGVGYSPEYYNLLNFTLKNSTAPQNINLFDLSLDNSTDFLITVKDENFKLAPGVLVNIMRQYITENNTFKTVELPKTDSQGQTVGHFVLNDVRYNILVTNGTNGALIAYLNDVVPFCEDLSTGNCRININGFLTTGDIFNYNEEIKLALSTPVFNQTTRILSVDFYTFDGSTQDIELQAFKFDMLGNTSVCNNTLSSSAGTLSCTVPNSIGNSSLQLFIYSNDELVFTELASLDITTYNEEGYFYFFLLLILVIMFFLEDKSALIIATGATFVVSAVLKLIQGNVIGVGASLIFLIVAIIIIVWKENKNKT